MNWEIYLKALLQNIKKELEELYIKINDQDLDYDIEKIKYKIIDLSEEFTNRVKKGDF